MKFIQKLANERFARPAAQLMKVACYLVICFYVLWGVNPFSCIQKQKSLSERFTQRKITMHTLAV